MKRKKLIHAVALFALSAALFACGENVHESSSSPAPASSERIVKSKEELFQAWKQGRDVSLNRDDDYSTFETAEDYFNGVLEYKRSIQESRSGNRYFLEEKEESLDEGSSVLTLSDQSLICVKEVNDNGKIRTKLYEESLEEGESVKKGTYVSPSYAESHLHYQPKESFDGISIDVPGDSYSAFVKAFKAEWTKEGKTLSFEDLKFIENSDLSVTFSFAVHYAYVDDYQKQEDSDYLESVCHDQIDITGTSQGLQFASYVMDETTKYASKAEEKSKTVKTYQIDYAFDEKTYNGISIETETTENAYFGEANFYLDGYRIERNFEACLVDEIYTLENAKAYLGHSYSFLITDADVEARTDLFDLFLDEEFAIPFTGQAMPESLDLCIRLNTEKGAFVEAWFKVKGTKRDEATGEDVSFFYNKIKLVYHVAIGETFNKNRQIFEDYPVLEFDGKPVEEGYRPVFVCKEARIYKVLFDAGDTWL